MNIRFIEITTFNRYKFKDRDMEIQFTNGIIEVYRLNYIRKIKKVCNSFGLNFYEWADNGLAQQLYWRNK